MSVPMLIPMWAQLELGFDPLLMDVFIPEPTCPYAWDGSLDHHIAHENMSEKSSDVEDALGDLLSSTSLSTSSADDLSSPVSPLPLCISSSFSTGSTCSSISSTSSDMPLPKSVFRTSAASAERKKTKQRSASADKRRSRMFVCTICSKVFADGSNFTRHARVHTGERPFGCSHCGTSFSNSSNRNKHEKTCEKTCDSKY